MTVRFAVAALVLTALSPLFRASAQTTQPARTVQVTAASVSGAPVTVPQSDRPSLLLFLRVDQEQSKQAIQQVQALLKDLPPAQVVVILSGKDLETPAKTLAGELAWPVVLDSDYRLVGQLQVRVWPTSILVQSAGAELARVTGLGPTYSRDLLAYLAFATGQIDRATLDQRLASTEFVADSAAQKASRHLQVAQRLLEKGELDQAQAELEEGLKLQPRHTRLQLTMARLLLMREKPQEAATLLAAVSPEEALAPEASTLKGWALAASGQWDQAIPVLQSAIRLNPSPATAQYWLGRAYEQKGQWAEAAKAFRMAYEAAAQDHLAPPPPPATQPARMITATQTAPASQPTRPAAP